MLTNLLLITQTVIKGHDGIVKAYGDYRDDLILKLKDDYNNIKVKYDKDIFDVDSFVGHNSQEIQDLQEKI